MTTNGVTTFTERELPFAHVGFGQDAEWVAGNFTNATEILAMGYQQWGDTQVGSGLENGLYKLTATLADDPPETTWLTVGGCSMAVTSVVEDGVSQCYTVNPCGVAVGKRGYFTITLCRNLEWDCVFDALQNSLWCASNW